MKALLAGGVVVFLLGAVFGGIIGSQSASDYATYQAASSPAPTVTETATVEVTQYALTPECHEALRQSQVTLDAGMQVSDNIGGLEQIIADTKRAAAVQDVAALSQAQADLIAYEKTNVDSFAALGQESMTLDQAITDCLESNKEDK